MRQYRDVEAQVFGGEQPHRAVEHALAVEAYPATAGLGGDAVVFEEAWYGFGIVGVELQLHRCVGVRSAVEHRADETGVERREEFQRAQRGVATLTQCVDLRFALEQALVFAQCVFDLAIARQRGVVVDAQALRGLEFGLMEIADAAFGDEPGGFMGEPCASLAGLRFGVLAGVVHGQRPGGAWR